MSAIGRGEGSKIGQDCRRMVLKMPTWGRGLSKIRENLKATLSSFALARVQFVDGQTAMEPSINDVSNWEGWLGVLKSVKIANS